MSPDDTRADPASREHARSQARRSKPAHAEASHTLCMKPESPGGVGVPPVCWTEFRFLGRASKRREPGARAPPEFRKRMVALARAGRGVENIAREFEPCVATIRGWIKQADRHASGFARLSVRRPGSGSNATGPLSRARADTGLSHGFWMMVFRVISTGQIGRANLWTPHSSPPPHGAIYSKVPQPGFFGSLRISSMVRASTLAFRSISAAIAS